MWNVPLHVLAKLMKSHRSYMELAFRIIHSLGMMSVIWTLCSADIKISANQLPQSQLLHFLMILVGRHTLYYCN